MQTNVTLIAIRKKYCNYYKFLKLKFSKEIGLNDNVTVSFITKIYILSRLSEKLKKSQPTGNPSYVQNKSFHMIIKTRPRSIETKTKRKDWREASNIIDVGANLPEKSLSVSVGTSLVNLKFKFLSIVEPQLVWKTPTNNNADETMKKVLWTRSSFTSGSDSERFTLKALPFFPPVFIGVFFFFFHRWCFEKQWSNDNIGRLLLLAGGGWIFARAKHGYLELIILCFSEGGDARRILNFPLAARDTKKKSRRKVS